MSTQLVKDRFIDVQASGDTYLGNENNQTYTIREDRALPGNAILIRDTGGDNVIELPNDLTITSSVFYSDEVKLSLSNGASVIVVGADKGFTYNAGTETGLSFEDFATVLGVSLPTGNDPANGGAITIGDSTPPSSTTTINLSATDTTTQQGTDGIAETFIYEIDSSNYIVESRETGDISLQGFNASEDKLIFEDVATGKTSTSLFIFDALISSNTNTQINFETAVVNNDDIVVAEPSFSLTLVGITDFSTIDYSVA